MGKPSPSRRLRSAFTVSRTHLCSARQHSASIARAMQADRALDDATPCRPTLTEPSRASFGGRVATQRRHRRLDERFDRTVMSCNLAIVPAFNEAEAIADTVAAINQWAPDFDVLVVDDGSSDATADRARCAGAEVLSMPFNL